MRSTLANNGCYIKLLVFGLLLLSHSLTSNAENLSDAQRVQVYDEAVHILGGNANVISRWSGDINYHIIGSTEFQEATIKTLSDVAATTKLKALRVESDASSTTDFIEQQKTHQCGTSSDNNSNNRCANFVVVQSSRENMVALAAAIPLRKVYQRALASEDPIRCFFAPLVSSRQIIEQAYVYVSDDLPQDMIQTCLNEEIYQSLGLFNDFSGANYFSFNNVVEPKEITDYDRKLLATLYDPKFKPGTPVFRVMKRYMNVLKFSQK